MSEWKRVEKITNIKLTVDGGQESSSIYGNEKNCVAFLVTFNGSSDEYPEIDLRDVDVGAYISLVDFETGDSLPLERIPTDRDGLFYSREEGKFCNSPGLAKLSTAALTSEGERRAHIFYYLYGKCKADMKQLVAVNIVLHNGNTFSTARKSEDPLKVELLIKRPIRYDARDLEPVEWVSVPLKGKTTSDIALNQTVAYVRLKMKFGKLWVEQEFKDFDKYEGKLVYAARVTQDDTLKYIYRYYLCPMGRLSSHKLKIGGSNVEFEYNQEPNAFCMTRIAILRPTVDDFENFISPGFFVLYDKYGNLGSFKLQFKDSEAPTVVDRNFQN